MAREIIPHTIEDWSKIDEKDAFWGKIDLSKPEDNFGVHRYNGSLWTSGKVGIGRLFDKDNKPIQDGGREHVLIISSSYHMNPWKMLETVMLDEEYDDYLLELEAEKKYLYKIFYNQNVIKLPNGVDTDSELLIALSFVYSCFSLCQKGVKKELVKQEENYTAKLRGKVDVNKNIKHNTVKGRCDRFYCKYIDFTEDTTENRIIKAALTKCRLIIRKRFPDNQSISSKMSYCLNSLKHVKSITPRNTDFNRVTISGLYSYYKPVIQQAKAILGKTFQNYSESIPKTKHAEICTIPYMINMETLFEYYARTVLKRALQGSCFKLEKYSKKYFLQRFTGNNEDAEKEIHLMQYCIPDIVVSNSVTGEPITVIDAKYKPNTRSNRSDSHQLLAYVLLTDVGRCGFVLPGDTTEFKKMKTTGNEFLQLNPSPLEYYELLLSDSVDSINELVDLFQER